MGNDIATKAKEKAARMVAEAEREAALTEWAPTVEGCELNLVVVQNDSDWLRYKVATPSDMLRIFDAFDLIPIIQYRDGTTRGHTFEGSRRLDRDRITETESYWGAVQAYGRCHDYMSGASDVVFFVYAKGMDSRPVRVAVEFGTAYYSKPHAPATWVPHFRKEPPRHPREPAEWIATGPAMFSGLPSIRYSTGAPRPGMAYQGIAFSPVVTRWKWKLNARSPVNDYPRAIHGR